MRRQYDHESYSSKKVRSKNHQSDITVQCDSNYY